MASPVPYATTVAVVTSLRGPFAPRRVTHRARSWACMPPPGDSNDSTVEPSLTLCTQRNASKFAGGGTPAGRARLFGLDSSGLSLGAALGRGWCVDRYRISTRASGRGAGTDAECYAAFAGTFAALALPIHCAQVASRAAFSMGLLA